MCRRFGGDSAACPTHRKREIDCDSDLDSLMRASEAMLFGCVTGVSSMLGLWLCSIPSPCVIFWKMCAALRMGSEWFWTIVEDSAYLFIARCVGCEPHDQRFSSICTGFEQCQQQTLCKWHASHITNAQNQMQVGAITC